MNWLTLMVSGAVSTFDAALLGKHGALADVECEQLQEALRPLRSFLHARRAAQQRQSAAGTLQRAEAPEMVLNPQ